MAFTRAQFGNKDLGRLYEGVILATNSKLVYISFTGHADMAALVTAISAHSSANPTHVQISMCVVVVGAVYEALVTYSTN